MYISYTFCMDNGYNYFLQVKHESGSRHYNRVQSLVRNPQKFSVVFHNEFQRYAYCSRKPGESKSDWQNRYLQTIQTWYFYAFSMNFFYLLLKTGKSFVKALNPYCSQTINVTLFKRNSASILLHNKILQF